MLSFLEECIIVFQAPAQFPKIKMSPILLSINLTGFHNHMVDLQQYQFEIYKLWGHQLLMVESPQQATELITGYQMLLTQTQLIYKRHASQISNSKSVQITWFLKS